MKKTDIYRIEIGGESIYRIEIGGERIYLTYEEINKVRKDILLYYDENIGEPYNLFIPGDLEIAYWKYVSINVDKQEGESTKYKKLIEEGCLAIVSGIAMYLLDEPVNCIRKEWRGVKVEEITTYLVQYQPQTDKLRRAKSQLMDCFEYINKLSHDDLTEYGMLKNADFTAVGKWFDEQIIREYYQLTLKNTAYNTG